jgi:23S rRNA (uracil1939-C5)-methyltransferase
MTPQPSISPDIKTSESPDSITIEKLVYGGDGLGHLDSGEVVFVPWSVPGDRLLIERLSGKQKPVKGNLLEIMQPAAERITPPCSVFGTCGGCQWQQISTPAQREWKRKIVEESLHRLGKLTDVQVSETLGSDATQWHFRNRVQWDVQWNADTRQYELGYCKSGSNEVIAFDTCLIISLELNQLANWLQDYFQQNSKSAASIQRVEVLQNAEGHILCSIYGKVDQVFCDAVTEAFPTITGIVTFDPKQKFPKPKLHFGQNFIFETIREKKYKVSAGSFFQTNRHATELILDTLETWMPAQTDSLLDVYSGVGLFALHFKDRATQITTVESSRSSVEDAQENITQHGAFNIQPHMGDAGKFLKNLTQEFETVILDPPRAGCQPEVLAWLGQNKGKQIFYVSCNPTTLARDLKTLVEAGWKVQAVQPVDMFPQTYHVETIVHLTR